MNEFVSSESDGHLLKVARYREFELPVEEPDWFAVVPEFLLDLLFIVRIPLDIEFHGTFDELIEGDVGFADLRVFLVDRI